MMICEITGSHYNHITDEIEEITFNIEINDCICETRFEAVDACLITGYTQCMKRGLEFEKMEIIAE